MFIFKTSGQTLSSVIKNAKHAFVGKPKDWFVGEKVLVSKNKKDCAPNEKQISHIMEIEDIRPLAVGEANKYWAGTEGRWRYLVICRNTQSINEPFNLNDVLSDEAAAAYGPVMTHKKISHEDEIEIVKYLTDRGVAI